MGPWPLSWRCGPGGDGIGVEMGGEGGEGPGVHVSFGSVLAFGFGLWFWSLGGG